MLEDLNREEQELAHRLRLQEIGMMASGIAHEFNNLLTPIMGYSLMVLERLSIEEETDNYDSVLEIYSASQKAKEIIQQISYLSSKKVDPTFKRLVINDLMEKSITIAAFSNRGNIEINKDFNCQGACVMGNETLLTQIMVNIYINAYQAMSKSGGTLSIKTYCREEETSKIIIEIANTGDSIDQEIIQHIFEPFFTTKENGKGTGLGLTIVKRIVEEHNGSISVSNNDGDGVTFTIILPAAT
jgi:signal transduction histidine kinase